MFTFSDQGRQCCSTHLIDGDGAFNVSGIDTFMKEVKLAERGLSYAVVSIMGPLSSATIIILFISCYYVFLQLRHFHSGSACILVHFTLPLSN